MSVFHSLSAVTDSHSRMKATTFGILATLLTACSPWKYPFEMNGRQGYSLWGYGPGDTLQKAAELCHGQFDVIDRENQQGTVATGNASGTPYGFSGSAFAAPYQSYWLTVLCK